MAGSARSRWLVWSDDSGVFPLRNAVERARPSAPVVPALPRAPDAADLRARTCPVAMEHTRIAQRGGRAGTLRAATATRLPVDRGTTATCPASAPPAPPAGPDPALRRDAPLGICRPRDDGRRSPRRAAAPGTVTVVGARDPDHHRRGSRCRRAAAPGALRAVDCQPRHVAEPDRRRGGCLLPLVNLAWAPVFVMELALAEDRFARLRREIWVWWALFVASTAVSVFATATSFTGEPQGIADNTVSFIVAYLLAMATVVVAAQLVFAFERAPVERPAHRWVVVAQEAGQAREPGQESEKAPEKPAEVEREGQEPAA